MRATSLLALLLGGLLQGQRPASATLAPAVIAEARRAAGQRLGVEPSAFEFDGEDDCPWGAGLNLRWKGHEEHAVGVFVPQMAVWTAPTATPWPAQPPIAPGQVLDDTTAMATASAFVRSEFGIEPPTWTVDRAAGEPDPTYLTLFGAYWAGPVRLPRRADVTIQASSGQVVSWIHLEPPVTVPLTPVVTRAEAERKALELAVRTQPGKAAKGARQWTADDVVVRSLELSVNWYPGEGGAAAPQQKLVWDATVTGKEDKTSAGRWDYPEYVWVVQDALKPGMVINLIHDDSGPRSPEVADFEAAAWPDWPNLDARRFEQLKLPWMRHAILDLLAPRYQALPEALFWRTHLGDAEISDLFACYQAKDMDLQVRACALGQRQARAVVRIRSSTPAGVLSDPHMDVPGLLAVLATKVVNPALVAQSKVPEGWRRFHLMPERRRLPGGGFVEEYQLPLSEYGGVGTWWRRDDQGTVAYLTCVLPRDGA